MLRKLDKGITLRGLEHPSAQSEPLGRVARSVAIVLGIALCFSIGSAASATTAPMKTIKTMTPKEFARIQLSKDLYICLSVLYGKESAWRSDARNGSHYGIPQGRSEFLKDKDGITQVRWGLKYISHRYGYTRTMRGKEPNTCAALNHWKRKGWH